RLEADDAAIHARLRLVMNIDLAARDREPQVLLQRALFAQLPVGLRLEEADRAARVLLRVLQRDIGVRHQRGAVAAVVRIDRDADADAGLQGVSVGLDRGVERGDDTFAEYHGRLRLRSLRRDDGELVAADARAESAVASLARALGDQTQDGIAGFLAVDVVDGL